METPSTVVTIKVRENGPYVVTGPVTITDADGALYTPPEGKPNIALCRCGGSSTKPFCDGTHNANGFLAPERASGGEAP
ncbi:MAG: CDGSH iron-sulfur domain-containing protein [Candidatus Eremiobacteraeota bacterium]|nr:CDGSH iron-sulfur domain-containing protein [Candidatus Eremiobacteraeota bacterium]